MMDSGLSESLDACSRFLFPASDPLSAQRSVTEPLGPTGHVDNQRYRKSFNANFGHFLHLYRLGMSLHPGDAG